MRIFVSLWQNDQQEIAVKALESLCEYSEDDTQVLSALRSVTVSRRKVICKFNASLQF